MAEFRLSNFTSGAVLTASELNTGLTYASYTPDWTQGVAITKTVNWARYTKFGKMVSGSIKMTATGAGTANTKITVSLPVNASTNNFLMGEMMFVDDSSNTDIQTSVSAFYETASTLSFYPFVANGLALSIGSTGVQGTTLKFGQDFTAGNGTAVTGITVASGDIIYIQFQYEAA